MELYKRWVSMAYDKEGRSKKEIWDDYIPKEQKIYEYILSHKTNHLECTVNQLAQTYAMSAEYICGFIDGVNEALAEPIDVENITETMPLVLSIDFEKLYKKMVEYKAEHLYILPQWNCIFTKEKQRELYTEQKKSRTVVNPLKIGRNECCPCNSGKKYKKCCGA